MNRLAHLLLADPETDFRIAALLPDFMDVAAFDALPEQFQPEIQRHRLIDSYTDEHPVFRRSITRLDPPYRRYGGIVIDVFYDHFITTNWFHYSSQSLHDFLNASLQSFQRCCTWLPDDTIQHFQCVFAERWLSSYGVIPNIGSALKRISRRFKRYFDLYPCAAHLEEHYQSLSDDFQQFFGALVTHLKTRPRNSKPLLHLA